MKKPINYSTSANSISKYRERSEDYARTPISLVRFVCKMCKTRKPVDGRRQLTPGYPRDGWKCADCISKGK